MKPQTCQRDGLALWIYGEDKNSEDSPDKKRLFLGQCNGKVLKNNTVLWIAAVIVFSSQQTYPSKSRTLF